MAEIIGLDIGSHSIKVVGLKMTSRGPFLTRAGIKEIPYGREKGDLTFISEVIKALFVELALKPGKVRVTVSGSGVNVRRITIASMPKAELKEAVRWEVRSHLPFPVESAQIDFHILEEFSEDRVKKLDLIVVACPNHLTEQTLSIVAGAGLKATHLDVGPFALWNALLAWGQIEQEEGVALIDLGSDKTGIHFFKNGILQFSREVPPAGADLTRAIMEGIETEVEPYLLYERAEKIKREVGIPAEAGHEKAVSKSIHLSKISFLIRPVLERLAAEISRSLDYYRNQFQVDRVDRLLLTGGGSNLKNLSSYLMAEHRLPVELFNPLRKMLFDPKKTDARALDQEGPMFTVAAGVAIPAGKQVELLPAREPLWSSGARLGKLVPGFSLLATLLIFLWLCWHLSGQTTALKREYDDKMMKVKGIEMLRSRLISLKEKEIKMRRDLSLFPSSMIAPVSFYEIFRAVGPLVPENVTVTLLSAQPKAAPSKGESPVPEGRELHIAGLAFGSDAHCLTALARIIERLEKSSLFKNAKLVAARENKSYNRPGTEFEIVCDIAPDIQKREERP
jgi:type IV pilus assembly protein PilM